jgi:hypothetical protein
MAIHLARLQIGRLLLVDYSRIKKESLLTHPVLPEDISKPKASTLGQLCRRISPETQICAFNDRVEKLALIALDRFDAVLLATDNILAEIEVGQRCRWLGVPLLQASVYGDSLVAQVRHFSNTGAESSCPACGFSPGEWSALNREIRFSCQGLGTMETESLIEGPPTMSVSFLCSTAADLALNMIVRDILLPDKSDEDFLLEYCGYTNRTVVSPLARNPGCACDHTTLDRGLVPHPVAGHTLRQLANAAGFDKTNNLDRVSFQIDRLVFSELGVCRCESSPPLRRFYFKGNGAGICNACGEEINLQPFFTHEMVPSSIVTEEMDRPLQEIGAASARWAVVRGRDNSVLIKAEDTERSKT